MLCTPMRAYRLMYWLYQLKEGLINGSLLSLTKLSSPLKQIENTTIKTPVII
jgi:hypothetical protein